MKLPVMELLVAVLAVAGVYCGWRYYSETYLPEKQINTAIRSQLELFENIRPEILIETEEVSVATETDSAFPESESVPEITENFAESLLISCEEVNHAAVGWIYIPDTNIDYPVVQAKDNDFYLHNGFDGQYNYELGCPFLDYRCQHDFSGYTSIVYAHNIEDRAMFADVSLYKEKAFMQTHPEGFLILDDEIHSVSFFAYLTVPSNDMIYQTEFNSDSEYQEYIEYLVQSANYSLDFPVDVSCRLLLLSTCTFEYDEARGVLIGILDY
ncbi:MAG: class B sortase [Ruminococcus sp.]|nr:class B sortase [Ruminococcus sp.]